MKRHFAASVQRMWPILTGVHFVYQIKLKVVTDSHRMSQKIDYTGEKMEQLWCCHPKSLFVNSSFFSMILKRWGFFFANNQILLEVYIGFMPFARRKLSWYRPSHSNEFNTEATFNVANADLQWSVPSSFKCDSNRLVKLEFKNG